MSGGGDGGGSAGLPDDPDWWRGAVIYQIYPRSFQDSNADGIGDLRGVAERLEHVARLGADAIWISPFFVSPMEDFGYDVSDYCDVDPMFGTLEDFDLVVKTAHGLGLRVMIDLVLSHTSAKHPWFEASRSDPDGPHADWYVWADAKPDGTPPNNWLSIFGGPAWEWDPRRMQYYLHNFLTTQPDLNFHNPEVQEALLDVARFWLRRGVDGFRLDTINFYVHDRELRDNPALPTAARNASIAPAVNPYNWQEHLYDKNRPENLAFLERLRAVMDEFGDTAAVGEVGDAQRGLQIVAQYTRGEKRMHMCYAFDFLSGPRLHPHYVAEVMEAFETTAPDGWSAWAFSNHDVTRHATRWELPEKALRLHAALLLSLRGSVCLYQGEELGLTEAEIAFDELRDPYGIRFWPGYRGRDGCRTPMVWRGDQPGGGFTDVLPWLPVPRDHLPKAAGIQDGDPESLLNAYRRFIAFRRAHPALVKGAWRVLAADEQTLTFLREHERETLFCAFNLSGDPAGTPAPEGARPLADHGFDGELAEGGVRLAPWDAFFARIE